MVATLLIALSPGQITQINILIPNVKFVVHTFLMSDLFRFFPENIEVM